VVRIKARFDASESPSGRSDWVPISAFQPRGDGTLEVTLHVVEGKLHDLEIWAGYRARPRIQNEKLERATDIARG
jgi:hypothetical protein